MLLMFATLIFLRAYFDDRLRCVRFSPYISSPLLPPPCAIDFHLMMLPLLLLDAFAADCRFDFLYFADAYFRATDTPPRHACFFFSPAPLMSPR